MIIATIAAMSASALLVDAAQAQQPAPRPSEQSRPPHPHPLGAPIPAPVEWGDPEVGRFFDAALREWNESRAEYGRTTRQLHGLMEAALSEGMTVERNREITAALERLRQIGVGLSSLARRIDVELILSSKKLTRYNVTIMVTLRDNVRYMAWRSQIDIASETERRARLPRLSHDGSGIMK